MLRHTALTFLSRTRIIGVLTVAEIHEIFCGFRKSFEFSCIFYMEFEKYSSLILFSGSEFTVVWKSILVLHLKCNRRCLVKIEFLLNQTPCTFMIRQCFDLQVTNV